MNSRRSFVSFNPFHFESQARQGIVHTMEEAFRFIYKRTGWKGSDSVSGEGAGMSQTQTLREALPALLRRWNVQSLLDVPCGDLSWMRHVNLPVKTYVGGDVLPEIVDANRRAYGDRQRFFQRINIVTQPLPAADALLCRDCMVHFSFADIGRMIANVKGGNISYLLATSFTECEVNEDATTGDWRVLNLQRPPFLFPEPDDIINENCTEGGGLFSDKCLALWKVGRIPTM